MRGECENCHYSMACGPLDYQKNERDPEKCSHYRRRDCQGQESGWV